MIALLVPCHGARRHCLPINVSPPERRPAPSASGGNEFSRVFQPAVTHFLRDPTHVESLQGGPATGQPAVAIQRIGQRYGVAHPPQNSHAKVRLQADRSVPDQTRILLDVQLGQAGRPTGTARVKGHSAPRSCGMSRSATSSGTGPRRVPFEVAGLTHPGLSGAGTLPLSLGYPAGQPLKGTLRLHLQQCLHPDRLPLHPGGGWGRRRPVSTSPGPGP